MLGDCITTSVYERNTKVTQSSYISKVNELRNAVPNTVIPFVELTIKCKIRPFF